VARIVDETTGTVVAGDASVARCVAARTRGLMFRGRLAEGEALVIDPCSSIHMMWMRFPIDAVFYNRDGVVTKVARNVKPWIGFAMGGKGARSVIEMRVGDSAGIEPGHRLRIED
jgi:uncharacterized membrane protein (UPF0127 family)